MGSVAPRVDLPGDLDREWGKGTVFVCTQGNPVLQDAKARMIIEKGC